MLHFEHLTIGYADRIFIKNFTAHFLPGQLVGILGPNGSGKTTLLKTIAKLTPPTEGRIILGGMPLQAFSEQNLARVRSYIPAELTCAWPLATRHVLEIGRSADHRNWIETLDLGNLLDQTFNTLSSGEKARVLLAHSLMRSPKVILADEITSHLDALYQDKLMDLLRDYTRTGKVGVVVLHQPDLAYEFCDQVFMIEDQKLHLLSKKPPQLKGQILS